MIAAKRGNGGASWASLAGPAEDDAGSANDSCTNFGGSYGSMGSLASFASFDEDARSERSDECQVCR